VFMSSCTVFVFFSLMEYALVNVVLGDVPEEPTTMRNVRPRTLLQVSRPQDSPKKAAEDFEDVPSRSTIKDTGQAVSVPRRSPAVQRRANGRKSICQGELDTITTITSPAASPGNGLSPLEILAQTSCPAHLPTSAHFTTSSHLTTSQMTNGPLFSGIQDPAMHHPGMQHPGMQHHSGMQHTFGPPPPPPPPPLGPAKAPKHQRRRRER
ncbi:hypothetical protein OTU49_008874, partial [Cherax quadricarinatus]